MGSTFKSPGGSPVLPGPDARAGCKPKSHLALHTLVITYVAACTPAARPANHNGLFFLHFLFLLFLLTPPSSSSSASPSSPPSAYSASSVAAAAVTSSSCSSSSSSSRAERTKDDLINDRANNVIKENNDCGMKWKKACAMTALEKGKKNVGSE